MTRRTPSVLALHAVMLLAAGSVRAQPYGPRIVNGVLTADYPSTGALLYANGSPATASNATSWCSGTLIGCETFLTAAHCVADDSNTGNGDSGGPLFVQNGCGLTVVGVTSFGTKRRSISASTRACLQSAPSCRAQGVWTSVTRPAAACRTRATRTRSSTRSPGP